MGKKSFLRKRAKINFMHMVYLRYGAPHDFPWDMDYFDRIEEEENRWAEKKYLTECLEISTITEEMKQYVVEKCKKDKYDVTMENFNDAIISLSPRGAFARSYLAEIDDRSGIYKTRTRCVDANTTSLVSAISEMQETTIE